MSWAPSAAMPPDGCQVRALRLLLDTHVVLWWFAGQTERIGPAVTGEITDAEDVFVSAASAWEIEIKRALGKLDAPDDLGEAIASSGFRPLGIEIDHAIAAGRLPPHHSDPFDRMLVAQAQADDLILVTADNRITRYDVRKLMPGSSTV